MAERRDSAHALDVWAFLGSLLFWGFILATSLICFPIAVLIRVVTAPFDPKRIWLHRWTSFWASLYTWCNPAWRVTVAGRERLDERRPVVFVANHLSLVDILVLFRIFTHYKWVSKIENFRVPLIGWNMHLNGYIPLRRGDAESVAEMMERCDETLAEGNSILIFPEGTRSANGRLRRFKPGAFQIALRNRVPIQPILVRGTSEALPKRGFVLRGRHRISVEILDPIEPESFEALDASALKERIRDLFVTRLEKDPLEDLA